MGLIESNLQSASHYAQMIMDSANRIESGGKGSKDSTSTISGNRLAGPLIDQEHRYALQITGQLKTFVSNVQTIASNFEAVDTRLAGTIEAELGSALQTDGEPSQQIIEALDDYYYDFDDIPKSLISSF